MKIITISQLKNCTAIGIDVSKASLSVAGLTKDKTYIYDVKNTVEELDHLAGKLVKANYTGKIICESTGHYHLKLVSVFSKYPLELYVLNPLQSSKHSKANIRKTKSDPVDAETLATMCFTERNLPKPINSTDDKILIRLKMGQVCFIEKLIQRIRGSVNLYAETYQELGFVESDIQLKLKEMLEQMRNMKEQMLAEIVSLVSAKKENKEDLEDVQRIPGISAPTAALLTQFDREVKDGNSWVAYVGLDTSVRESGTWKGRGKITKRGNRYLRKRLFLSAWGAMMHDKQFRAYYDKLRSNGRSYREALCIIAKKQIRIAYLILVRKENYDSSKAF